MPRPTRRIQRITRDRLLRDHLDRLRALEANDPLRPVLFIKVFGDARIVQTGDGKFIFACSDDMDGKELVRVASYVTTVSSSGKPTVQIRNVTQAVDMLTTKLSVDVGEFTSYSAAVPAVIDSANAKVDQADLIAIDVDIAGTGAKGLGVMLWFEAGVNGDAV